MKLILKILFFIALISLSACLPVKEEPTENTSPVENIPVQTNTPMVTSVWLLPITEQGNDDVQVQHTKSSTDIPAELIASPIPTTQVITITIVYDNYQEDQKLISDWGFSVLIEYSDNTVLFDTGANGQILMQNMQILGIDPIKIDSVVLSHPHDDHIGGLLTLLKAGVKPTVYLLTSFPAPFKNLVKMFTNVIEVSPGQSITQGIWTTGDVGGEIPEQSLAVETDQGIILITGCAHPGISKILKQVYDMKNEPLYMILGGFHLGSKSEVEINAILQDFRSMEAVFVAPCHCTGDFAIEKFATEFGSKYMKIGVGSQIRLEAYTVKQEIP